MQGNAFPSNILTEFKPSSLEPTTLKQQRRVVRGDFGPTKESKTNYPNFSLYNSLQQLLNQVTDVPYCGGPSFLEEQDIPDELKKRAQELPPEQRCLEAVKYYSDQLLEKQVLSDRRRLTGPKYGEPATMQFASLPRLEKAKIHLDRARQMYLSGKANLSKGISNRNTFVINRGRGSQYTVQPDHPQLPKLGKTSALYELYEAYKQVRDYEMNPLPPVLSNGQPNPDRIREDESYDFIMGTGRMLPNRLGLGSAVRSIWQQYGLQDPNYYGIGVEAEPEYAQLYASVSSTDARGPERVTALYAFLKDRFRATNDNLSSYLPYSDQLAGQGYPNRGILTDMTRALININDNFVPPKFVLQNPESTPSRETILPGDVAVPVEAVQGPPPTVYLPFASLGQPYSPGSWPFDGTVATLPQVQEPKDYVPVFFPTGLSHRAEIDPDGQDSGPPYWQIQPTPQYGAPNPVEERMWDARVAAELLASYHKRLGKQAIEYMQLKNMLAAQLYGKEDPNYQPPLGPLTFWPSGKSVWETNVRVPPKNYNTQDKSFFLFNSGEKKEKKTTKSQNLYNPRNFGVDTVLYTFDKLPNVVNSVDSAKTSLVEYFYPLGLPDYLKPQKTDFKKLPPTAAEQNRMLQHALYLLSAPQTPWQRQNLPERALMAPPLMGSREVGSPTFGMSAPGDGYAQRNNQGEVVPTDKGWKGYYNPFLLNPQGGIAGRSFLVDGPPYPVEGLRTSGIPIGPLRLDSQFGNLGHVPGKTYNPKDTIRLWVIRTNQRQVMGKNTWGLDFYGIGTSPP